MAGEKPPCTGTVRAHPDRDAAIALRTRSRAHARALTRCCRGRPRSPATSPPCPPPRAGRSKCSRQCRGSCGGRRRRARRECKVSGAVRSSAPRSARLRAPPRVSARLRAPPRASARHAPHADAQPPARLCDRILRAQRLWVVVPNLRGHAVAVDEIEEGGLQRVVVDARARRIVPQELDELEVVVLGAHGVAAVHAAPRDALDRAVGRVRRRVVDALVDVAAVA